MIELLLTISNCEEILSHSEWTYMCDIGLVENIGYVTNRRHVTSL